MIGRLGRRARQWWRPGGVILLYHRVAELGADPWSLAVTPAHFAEHLAVLEEAYWPVSLAAVKGDGWKPFARPRVAITFDDGYADNWQQAAPLLVRAGLPATFFVPAGMVDCRREYWWDELEGLLLHQQPLPGELALRIGADTFNWRLQEGKGDSRLPLYYTLWKCLQPLPAGAREAVLEQLRQWAGRSGEARLTHRPLSAGELQALAGVEGMEIGAHTVTHPSLAALPPAEQQMEIEQGKTGLEAMIGRPVSSFAYPYGRPSDFMAETVALVRAAGFSRACTNQSGLIKQANDPYQLPRLFVRDCDGDGFAAWLRKRRLEIGDG